MSRIDDIFADLRRDGRKALMPFVCAGHPRRGDTALLLPALERAGASVVEVGFPYTDPIADGPVIAQAMHGALRAGVTPRMVFEEVGSIREWLKVGLVAMVSYSIVHGVGGAGRFVGMAKDAGFDGLIVPDLPLEESGEVRAAAAAAGLTMSMLIAPSTPVERAEALAKASTGFVYLLARAGITGDGSGIPDVSGRVSRLRTFSPLPVAVGFGVSTPEQVRGVVRHADAAIVGSALVRRLTEAKTAGRDPIAEAEGFVGSLAGGLVG
ncbi:MAG: tryptophan synthase alpha chain [Phycisphaerae bacterium]|nr:MAG: tryptophan synthase alpha chain [Phycisphaerae bacterium]